MLLMKPSLQTIRQEADAFKHCIINLLTDIETFSISVGSSNSSSAFGSETASSATDALIQAISGGGGSSLKHEIQLLIDECLVLIVGAAGSIRQPVCDQYRGMFESWLASSKDSPILAHFINRISRNYNLLIASSTSESYCHLLELCLEVFFETDREQQQQLNTARSVVAHELEFHSSNACFLSFTQMKNLKKSNNQANTI